MQPLTKIGSVIFLKPIPYPFFLFLYNSSFCGGKGIDEQKTKTEKYSKSI
uniref:Uncharacterized protein n=1 Tax=Lepeophtheirus salmonis TaxID=72036 RepID=A0A0K2TA77_LEPSM